ncbi:NIPSNAP family containing protein [Candidatus Sulfotelmatomonas gaucii]|uniref:NIPSNAP family containing protein n=1 Tax=Candidatus Sulfuritelmatomonas gaucii TaxID=2043161 RepID=A0A2N9LA76_9BACT|nr:NIPSNAP family containing protein [Candidatus Sulfotelmatomonas gaucii]
MERRQFLAASIAASALTATQQVATQVPAGPAREFYLLRRYNLFTGNQLKLTESYFAGALIPALARRGMGPAGAFRLDIGPETPAYYLLIPGNSVEALAELDLQLADDAEFLKAADPFWNATSTTPAFQRVEISLLAAFRGWPKITPPSSPAASSKRIFQLRTYESPSNGEHVRKVEMFHAGEFEIFSNAGFHPVFFGDALIGSRLPSLTYMLSFADLTELDTKWDVFRNDPAWKKLSSNPRYAYDAIVTNITNLILSPLACSQI